jgi:hypothetical protein
VAGAPSSGGTWRWISRLIAVGYALGSLAHATGWLLLLFHVEMYGAGYPAWRHVAFTVADASIAWIAARYPDHLFLPLLAFFIEQSATHGLEAWREWTSTGEILWGTAAMLAVFLSATIAAGVRMRQVRLTSR